MSFVRTVALIGLMPAAYVGAYFAMVQVAVTGPVTKADDDPIRYFSVETQYRFGGSVTAAVFLPIKTIVHAQTYPAYIERPNGTTEMYLEFPK